MELLAAPARLTIVGRILMLSVAALIIAGCGSTAAGTAKPSGAIAAISPSKSTTAIPPPRPFNLFTHCGILTTYFAGRTFYLAELYPRECKSLEIPEAQRWPER